MKKTAVEVMSEISENYDLYRRWFERSLDFIWNLPAELRQNTDPLAQLAVSEEQSQAAGIRALISGINDTIAMTDRFSREEISKTDDKFRKDGLPTLTSVRLLFSNRLTEVLRKGIADSAAEYDLLAAFEDADISLHLRERLDRIRGEYELRSQSEGGDH